MQGSLYERIARAEMMGNKRVVDTSLVGDRPESRTPETFARDNEHGCSQQGFPPFAAVPIYGGSAPEVDSASGALFGFRDVVLIMKGPGRLE